MSVGLVVAILAIALTGWAVVRVTQNPRQGTFCHPAMPIRSVHGKSVALETRGSDGGPCATPRTNPGVDTLGTDCKIRDPHGKVLETVTSTGNPDTC